MKVVFWNGVGVSNDVTNYMAAIGTILASEFCCEVVLGSNYISNHMLQDCFFSKMKEEGIAHAPYCFFHDSSEYSDALWKMKGRRQEDILERPMEKITVLFPPDVGERLMFYHEISKQSFYLLEIAEGNYLSFQNALEEADKIVVFLPQNIVEIQNFFYRFSPIIPKMIFVLKESSQWNKSLFNKLISEYGINSKNIGSVSQSNEFNEACVEGKLEAFLKRNRSTRSPHYSFLVGIRRIANLLFEYKHEKGV